MKISKLNLYRILANQLTDFGLNPTDWKVVNKGRRFYAVCKWDPTFKMIGDIELDRRRGLQWKKLQLASI